MFFLKQHSRLFYIFIYIIGCLFSGTSLFAQVTNSKVSIDKLFDELSLELSKEYFDIKGLEFDSKVLTENQLKAYLKKYFPKPKHEFRKSISNFHQFKNNLPIGSSNNHYEIETAINRYFTFDYDSVKISSIIDKYFVTEVKGNEERNPSLGSGTKPFTTKENEKKPTQPILSQDKKNVQDPANYYVIAGIFFVLGLVAAIIIIKVKTSNNIVESYKSGSDLRMNTTDNPTLTPPTISMESDLPRKSNEENDDAIGNAPVKTVNDNFNNGPAVSENEPLNTLATSVRNIKENEQSKNDEVTLELESAKIEHSIVPEVSLSQISETSVVAATIVEITKEDTQVPKVQFDEHAIFDNHWLILHTSQTGKSHISTNPPIPCQDNHAVLSIKDGWGVAVSCDGAGSALNSYYGSKLVSEKAATYFKNEIENSEWYNNVYLPSEKDWKDKSNFILKRIVKELNVYGNEKGYSLKSLACTIIVIVYSPKGLLCAHIGDGRACYRDQNGQWKAIITPHKGDEANQTIFITSNWMTDGFKMSGKFVPECIIVKEEPTAFALMSDGCETHSFELGYFDKEKNMFFPENKPFVGFFEPIYKHLKGLKNEDLDLKNLNHSWGEFINKGNSGLTEESDDKTLIIGVVKANADSV